MLYSKIWQLSIEIKEKKENNNYNNKTRKKQQIKETREEKKTLTHARTARKVEIS